MRLLARLKALEQRHEGGCALCRGRVVLVTHFPPDWPAREDKPAGEAPIHICPACGRDFGLHLRIEYERRAPLRTGAHGAG